MKLQHVLSSIVLSVLMAGCGNKDFTGKVLNSYLGAPPPSSQCQAQSKATSSDLPTSNQQSLFETKGKKVQLQENNYGDAAPFASAKASNPIIAEGKKLIVVANEKCIKSEREADSDIANEGLTADLDISETSSSTEKSFLVTLDQDTELASLEYMAESDTCVKGVGENAIYHALAVPNDPQFAQQEHLVNLKAALGWDVFFDSTSGIKQDMIVAVIDSGVDQAHPDLTNVRWTNTKELNGTAGVDDDNNGYVDDVYGYNFASNIANPNPQAWTGSEAGGETHGTHVAGLAAAQSNNGIGVSGVNGQKSRIMALNVFGAVAGASTDNIDNAIRYAADKGANVINMSLGSTQPASSTDSAIKYAISKGVFVVIAAGNSNADTAGFYPAAYAMGPNGALAVGAIDSVASTKCSFSNFSTTYVEMAAPGCKAGTQGVLSTLKDGAYGRLQGTSMASPVTAGVASLAYGLIWARTGQKPAPALVEEVMIAGARVEPGLTGSFKEGKVVDLVSLSTEINRRYPASGAPPNPSPGCP